MRLTLVPPSACPIPPLLQTHVLDPPTLLPPRSLRTPPAWIKAKKALSEVGLQLPNYLAADRALWWLVAVKEVEWNLEEEEVVVNFVDGAEERWELDGGRSLSNELVVDSEVEDGVAASAPTPNEPHAESRWSPQNVLTRLREFSHELRSAYEDLGTASARDPLAPDISSESDYLLLMQLAAEPAKQVPFEWSDAQTLYEYAMEGLIDEDELDADEEVAQKRGSSSGPSQPGSDGVDGPSRDSHGKLHSRLRPTRTKAVTSGQSDAVRQPHDHLSTINLLSTIRTFLLNLFAHTIIPRLRQTMPPTYSLWVADTTIAWCRREAVKKGAYVADLILELLDDDGDAFDAAQDDDESMDDIFIDDDAALLYGKARVVQEQAEDEAKHERLATNPLRSMMDDFALRRWCESALDRHRAMDDLESDEVLGKPLWIKPVAPWDVSKPADGEASDLEECSGGTYFSVSSGSTSPRRLASTYPSPPTSPPLVDDIPVLPRPHFRSFSTSTDPDATDEEDATSDFDFLPASTSAHQYRPEFFRPEDLVGEQFLPSRLPKELLIATGERGPEMEVQRRSIVELLNEIAGLQKKIYDLQQFVSKEAGVWEAARAEERKGNPAKSSTRAPSGLRSPRPSATSPPPPKNSNKTIPLRAQPLRHQAADRRLSSALHTALNDIAPTEQDRNSTLKKVRLPRSQSATPKPRKRQKLNVENYKRVQALSTMVRADPSEQKDASTRKKKRQRERHDEGRGGALSPTQNALRLRAAIDGSTQCTAKKARKVKAMKREPASENVLASPLPILRPPIPPVPRRSVSTGAAFSGTTSDRHRTVLELSERRRRSLSDASHFAPVTLPSLPVSAVRTNIKGGAKEQTKGEEEEADDEFEEVEVGTKFAEEDDDLADWDTPVAAPSIAWASLRALRGGDEAGKEETNDEPVEAPTRPPSPMLRQVSPTCPSPVRATIQAPSPASPAPFERLDYQLYVSTTPVRPRLERSILLTPASPRLFIAPDLLHPIARHPTQANDRSPTPTTRATAPIPSSVHLASNPPGLAQRLPNTFAAAAEETPVETDFDEQDSIEVGELAGGSGGSEEKL